MFVSEQKVPQTLKKEKKILDDELPVQTARNGFIPSAYRHYVWVYVCKYKAEWIV